MLIWNGCTCSCFSAEVFSDKIVLWNWKLILLKQSTCIYLFELLDQVKEGRTSKRITTKTKRDQIRRDVPICRCRQYKLHTGVMHMWVMQAHSTSKTIMLFFCALAT